jgi:hypothetical protein
MRQITAAIQSRKYLEKREQQNIASWQTRTLATFIAGGYMVSEKDGNPALELARKISFDTIEQLQMEEAEKNSIQFKDGEPQFVSVEEVAEQNKTGSFERFMSQFGGGMTRD